ncbi:hypothetical protein MRX96_012232 [Rhipicephalus microplus]
MCSRFQRCWYTAAAERSASYSASFPSWGGGSQGVTTPASAAVGGHRETGERLCAPAARPTGALSACRLEEVRTRASPGAAVNHCTLGEGFAAPIGKAPRLLSAIDPL